MSVANIALGVSAVAGVVGVASGISAGNAARQNVIDQNTYNQQVTEQQKQYRLEVMQYNAVQYNKEVSHYSDQIDYEKSEFTRATQLITTQKSNIDADYAAKVGVELLKSVQQDVARSLQATGISEQGIQQGGKADVSQAERGVAGNSANIQSGEVSRQVGVAETAVQRNFDASQQQAKVELLGLKAQHDSSVASLQLPTFQPIAPPAPPAPVSPVNPAAPVTIPSAASVALGGVSAGLNLTSSSLNIGTSIMKLTNGG